MSPIVVILGASRGIGRAAAWAFARQGARLVLAARDQQASIALAAAIVTQGGEALALPCDVSDFAQVAAVVATAQGRWGRVDVLVNNAGTIQPIARLGETDPAAVAQALTINLLGTYHGLRCALPVMQAQGSGVVINVSSGAAHRPLLGWGAYCAGKAGAAMLTRAAALEMVGSGVRVVGVRPGTVDTAMQAEIRASGLNPVSQMQPDEHFRPWQPAHLLTWLAGPDAADLHGQEVDIRDPDIQRRCGLAQASDPAP